MDTTNRNTALASALTAELARSGVRVAVISPGSRSSPLALALEREPGIRTHVVLDERAAGFFALGAALATGRPAVVSCTSGSAAANLHPAVVEADEAAVPLLVLTSDRPPELRGIGAGQTIDQVKLYGSAARWFCEVGTHEADDAGLIHYRATAVRAFAEATAPGRRGPVHLNLSWRDPLGPEPRHEDVTATTAAALEGRGDEPLTSVEESLRIPDERVLAKLAKRLAGAERPLLLAGRHPSPALAGPLGSLSTAAGVPLLAEPTSQLRSGGHPRATVVSAYDLIARARPERLAPDLVIRFGDMLTSKPMREWLGSIYDLEEIVVDPPGRWHDPGRTARTLVRCDPVRLAGALSSRVDARDDDWAQSWIDADERASAAIDRILAEIAGGEPTEPAVHRLLGDAIADGEIVVLASSMPVRDHEAFAPGAAAGPLYLANRGANGIDGTIATAAGAAAAARRGAWVVLGDLALAHDLGGIATVAESVEPFRLLVINNHGGGIFEFLPQADQVERAEFDRLFITPSGLDLARVAALFDLDYVRIDDPFEISELGSHRRLLAEVRTDRRGNVEVHERIARAVAEAIASSGSSSWLPAGD